jgi:N-acetylglucosamine-6-phosphate deacetylase
MSRPATRTILASHYRTGETHAFRFERGRLVSTVKVRKAATAVFGPGFVDLQCNGYAGVDFNRRETEPIVIAGAIRAMWEHGCTTVLPTFITAAPDALDEFLSDMVKALATDADATHSVPCFHLEGPFISPEEGARGAHPKAHVRPVELKLWRHLQRIAGGRIGLVTLAPEVRGAIPFLTKLREEKILPALGHTLADAACISRAADAGAMMSTHLGNGCPQTIARHANPIFAQVGEDRLLASFIADGVHLPPEVLRALWRAKGGGVLVTDAMAAAGAPPGRYSIGDIEVEVGADRVVRQPGSKNLAGSALTMAEAVANLVRLARISLADAWDAASLIPWALLRQAGAVRGALGSTVLAEWNGGELKVLAALRGAKLLWAPPE